MPRNHRPKTALPQPGGKPRNNDAWVRTWVIDQVEAGLADVTVAMHAAADKLIEKVEQDRGDKKRKGTLQRRSARERVALAMRGADPEFGIYRGLDETMRQVRRIADRALALNSGDRTAAARHLLATAPYSVGPDQEHAAAAFAYLLSFQNDARI